MLALYGWDPAALVRWLFITAYRISEMYTAAGFSCRMSLDHSGSVAGRLAMEYMTPQKYRHTRVRNGTSWLTSFSSEPIRAMIRHAPTLNIDCSRSTAAARSRARTRPSPPGTAATAEVPRWCRPAAARPGETAGP